LAVVTLPYSGVSLDREVAVVLDYDKGAVVESLRLHRKDELEQVGVALDGCDEAVVRNQSHTRNGTFRPDSSNELSQIRYIYSPQTPDEHLSSFSSTEYVPSRATESGTRVIGCPAIAPSG
jgi:hypothetical protein